MVERSYIADAEEHVKRLRELIADQEAVVELPQLIDCRLIGAP
jgi:hypothetical protein